jgi:hypothetical protein
MTVLDQIDQQIENLRVDPNELQFTPQFAPLNVEDMVTEYEAQNGPPIDTRQDIQENLKEKSMAGQ